jgi:hypothetical protein
VTILSVEVEPELPLPYKSTTRLAAIDGITVPLPLIDDADSVHVILSTVDRAQTPTEAVPPLVISSMANDPDPTALEKTTVNRMGKELVGSVCMPD